MSDFSSADSLDDAASALEGLTLDNKASIILPLIAPPAMPSLLRRAADVRRRHLVYDHEASQAPGVYYTDKGDGKDHWIVIGLPSPTDKPIPNVTFVGLNDSDFGNDEHWESDSSATARSLTSTTSEEDTAAEDSDESNDSHSPFAQTKIEKGSAAHHNVRYTSQHEGTQSGRRFVFAGTMAGMLRYRWNDRDILHQGYTLELMITQYDEGLPDGCSDFCFRLLVDTGSGTTWLLGEPFYEITSFAKEEEADSQGDTDGRNIRYTLARASNQLSDGHSVIWDKGFGPKDVSGETLILDDNQGYCCYGQIRRAVLLDLLPEGQQFTIEDCYKWGNYLQEQPLTLRFRFAIGWALHHSIALEPFDGILGLAPARVQTAFEGIASENEQSFLCALQQRILPTFHRRGTTMYFGIRPPLPERSHQQEEPVRRSWLALNTWPCRDKPSWTVPLASPTHGEWTVLLVGIQFVSEKQDGTLQTLDIECKFSEPHMYLLDTGASTSDLPLNVWEDIDNNLFTIMGLSDNDIAVSGTSSSEAQLWIDWKFVAKDGSHVTVRSDAKRFLFDDEGALLVYPIVQHHLEHTYVLGINFFHTVFVAMHVPGTGESFIRIAPQEEGKYELPEIIP